MAEATIGFMGQRVVRVAPKAERTIGDVTLDKHGTFCIENYDALTHLDKDEARAIAQMLLEWADKP